MKKKGNNNSTINKAYLVYYLMLAIAIAIVVKIIIIQYVDGEELRAKAANKTIREFTIQADRGNIYSVNGDLIATSLPRFDIFVDFSEKVVSKENFDTNYDSLAFCLSRLFNDRSESEYRDILLSYRAKNETYGLIKKNISYVELKELRTFPLFRLGRYRGGIIAEKKEKRVHPYGILAQRTIGFSREGFHVGIEGSFDKQLAGKDGRRMMQRLSGGRFVPLNDNFVLPPKQGVDIVTTLDMQIQDVAENALYKHLAHHDADWGCAILMEVQTGEIKAIANLQRQSEGVYSEFFNHAIGTRYEPGSSFKLFSMLALIEDGGIDLDKIVKTGDGKIRFGKYEISDTHPLGDATVREVFEKSSNVGTIMLVMEKYKNQQSKFVDRLFSMALNKKMNLDIRGEQAAAIDHPKNKSWSRTSLPSMSIGYGVSITPLQLLAYYNAVANNGKLVSPMFIKEFKSSGESVKTFKTNVLQQSICSPQTAEILKDLLRGVVENGTARNLKNASVQIAGKTATARASGPGGYIEGSYVASFVGFFPADNPRYSCIVVVNRPRKGSYYGGSVAAPVFKDIAELVYAIDNEIHNANEDSSRIGVEALPSIETVNRKSVSTLLALMPPPMNSFKLPNTEYISLTKDSIPVFIPKFINKNVIPDVRGMNLRDAVFLLESLGCKINVSGKGKVVSQSVEPGTALKKGMLVKLNLKSN